MTKLDEPIFKISDVCAILGQEERRVQELHTAGLKTSAQLESEESGGWRRYSQRDLVAILVTQALMACGLTRQRAAMIVNDACRKYFLADDFVLLVDPAGMSWNGGNNFSQLKAQIEKYDAAIIVRLKPFVAKVDRLIRYRY